MSFINRLFGIPDMSDYAEDEVKLQLDQDFTLFETNSAGYIGGLLNLYHASGPNEIEVKVWLNFRDLDNTNVISPYLYLAPSIQHKVVEGEPHVPLWDIPEVYAPYGGRVDVKQTSGIAVKMNYYIYRR